MAVIEQEQREKVLAIPAYLAYEEMDGEAIPYKGYREVLAGNKKPEEIMGSSSIQAALVFIISGFLYSTVNRKKYLMTTNESGLHMDIGDNLANDIAIFERAQVQLNDRYFQDAPKVVIEVDIKGDLGDTSWNEEGMYMLAKSQKMLNFGVEKVVWILTKSKKIMISTAAQDWLVTDFDCNIPLVDDCILNVAKLLAEEEIEF